MARQTSKNRWVNGKSRLAWRANGSEFAGGHEMGQAVELGLFTLTVEGSAPRYLSIYDGYERGRVIEAFLETGEFPEQW